MKKKIFSTLLLVAFTLASTSMFVSCKDYDDDINANKDRIAALETTVNNLKSQIATLEGCCSTVQGEIAALKSGLDGKASKEDLAALEGKYAELSADLVKLEERVKALEDAKQVLEDAIAGKASQADLDELRTELAGIDQKIADALEDYAKINYVDAATQNLQDQINVFEKYRQALLEYLGLTDDDAAIAKVKELVESLKTAISKIGSFPADDLTADEVASLRKLLQDPSSQIDKVITEANILQFLLNKQLTSLVAVDMNVIGGVEHIEVPALYYQPVLAKVGEGVDEEFHYINPETDEIFDADVTDGSSDYLFDSGDMAPKASLGGVHSWADFAKTYGEGEKDHSVLSFYKVLVGEFVRLKTAKDISYGTFHALANPSSVDLSNAKFNFYTDTRIWGEQVESREGNDGFAVPLSEKIDGKNTVNNGGKISVNFTIPAWEEYVHQIARTADGNYVKNPFAPKDDKDAAEFASLHDSLNWVSLQAQVGTEDTPATVSSDFVVVTPALLHIQALADNAPEAKILHCNNFRGWTGENGLGGHMWKQARTAIKHKATHSVAFNKTLDIMPFVETHYTNLGFFMTWSTYDKKMDADMFKQLGLHYDFTLVDYEDGIHMTGESKHMTIEVNRDENADFGIESVIVTPRSVTAEGETIKDKVATREAIDREPLVRIDVVDSKGQILEVGYMKLIITDNLEPIFTSVEIPYDYYMNCGDEAGVTWSQVENLILAKIGELGYTKDQFEAEYELETYAKNADGSNKAGELAVQYYFLPSETSFREPAESPKKYYKADLADTLGWVKYTYQVPTKYDPKAKQTNILQWSISEKVADVARFITGKESAEEARQALLENKGTGFKEHGLITTVRFVKKGQPEKYQDMTAIYVDLIIPGDQVHFAYGRVIDKDLSHWYELNSAVKDVASEAKHTALEVHENVPTPAEEGDDMLEETDFQRSLLENFKKNIVTIDVPNPDKFSKYDYTDGKNVSFRFVLPQKGVNAEFDAVDGEWTVPAYSKYHGGVSEYTLHLAEPFTEANGQISYKAIYDQDDHCIVRIVGNRIEYQYNDCSDDILNWTGRYDNDGKDIYNEYMKSLMTFTSYIEIYTQDGPVCYNLLLEDRFFNAKFERPINPWAKNATWTDALNAVEKINVSELLTIKDWRDYAVDLAKKVNNAEGKIGFGFYNICELFAPYSEIRTDHAAEPEFRTEITAKLAADKFIAQEAIVKYVAEDKLDLASDIPALHPVYLKSLEKVVNGLKQSEITYTNNGGNVQKFHLFVPIYIKYNWGEYDNPWTYDGVNKNPAWIFNPSTFKVWAIITVDATTGNKAKKN